MADTRSGLTEDEARRRLAMDGFNEMPRDRGRTPLTILMSVLGEPMLALLLVGGLIYLALGSRAEALLLLGLAILTTLITVVQEARTERVLQSLRDMSSPRALVIRSGQERYIAGREVARGDIIRIAEGDRVPADAVLLQARDVLTDESLITGESMPVSKVAGTEDDAARLPEPGGDDEPFIYSGSLIVRGTGLAKVIATGPTTEMGKIGKSLAALDPEPPRIRRETRRLVRIFASVAIVCCLSATLLYGLFRGSWLEAALSGIALGMTLLPEEIPVVLAVFMAMGAWRISKAQVLTRKASAIEALGSATVLCTDKTGTLTENRMRIADLHLPDGAALNPDEVTGSGLPEAFCKLVNYGILACAPDPFDPMEKAFHTLGNDKWPGAGLEKGSEHDLKKTYGLRPDLLAMSNVWQDNAQPSQYVIAAKGAPEAISTLCDLDPKARKQIQQQVDAMAKQSLRVLGVACAVHSREQLPASQKGFKFQFLGLVGLVDPLRPSATEAVRECLSAGIRVIMITGDYPQTAEAIAHQAGIPVSRIITGDQFAAMNENEIQTCVRETGVFARIMPEQKLRIVQVLKAQGEVVAMTGDGVNDAPSLKAAHIGIAMGGRGTDVAREAASLVLLNDDFHSIVSGIRLGRRVYDNLLKAFSFIFAVHVPIAGLALVPLIFGLPIILGPIHIAFLEMLIDPACSLVFEAETEEDDVMRRPPRPPDQPLFTTARIIWSLVQGFTAFCGIMGVYLFGLFHSLPEGELRALVVFSLFLMILSLIVVNRAFSPSLITGFQRPNRALFIIVSAVVAVLTLALLSPVVRDLFQFGRLHIYNAGLAILVSCVVLVGLETSKLFLSTRRKDSVLPSA